MLARPTHPWLVSVAEVPVCLDHPIVPRFPLFHSLESKSLCLHFLHQIDQLGLRIRFFRRQLIRLRPFSSMPFHLLYSSFQSTIFSLPS